MSNQTLLIKSENNFSNLVESTSIAWSEVAKIMGNRTSVQCRNRWKQALLPKLIGMKSGGWSEYEVLK